MSVGAQGGDKTEAPLSRRHTLNSRPGGVHVRGGLPECSQWDDFKCQLGDFADRLRRFEAPGHR